MSINDKNMRMFQKWPGAAQPDLVDTKEMVYEKVILKVDGLSEKARRAAEINPSSRDNKAAYETLDSLSKSIQEVLEPAAQNRMTR